MARGWGGQVKSNANFRQATQRIEAGMDNGLAKAAAQLQANLKETLNQRNSLSGPPSSPGEAPGKRTGNLGRSVQIEREGNSYAVGTPHAYGRYLEYGTTKMDARPWLWRTVEASAAQLIRIVRNQALGGRR